MNNKEFKEKSVIVSTLDKFASKIYSLLAGGIFGRAFTSYSPENGKIASGMVQNGIILNKVDFFRRKVARNIENSFVYDLFSLVASTFCPLSFAYTVL